MNIRMDKTFEPSNYQKTLKDDSNKILKYYEMLSRPDLENKEDLMDFIIYVFIENSYKDKEKIYKKSIENYHDKKFVFSLKYINKKYVENCLDFIEIIKNYSLVNSEKLNVDISVSNFQNLTKVTVKRVFLFLFGLFRQRIISHEELLDAIDNLFLNDVHMMELFRYLVTKGEVKDMFGFYDMLICQGNNIQTSNKNCDDCKKETTFIPYLNPEKPSLTVLPKLDTGNMEPIISYEKDGKVKRSLSRDAVNQKKPIFSNSISSCPPVKINSFYNGGPNLNLTLRPPVTLPGINFNNSASLNPTSRMPPTNLIYRPQNRKVTPPLHLMQNNNPVRTTHLLKPETSQTQTLTVFQNSVENRTSGESPVQNEVQMSKEFFILSKMKLLFKEELHHSTGYLKFLEYLKRYNNTFMELSRLFNNGDIKEEENLRKTQDNLVSFLADCFDLINLNPKAVTLFVSFIESVELKLPKELVNKFISTATKLPAKRDSNINKSVSQKLLIKNDVSQPSQKGDLLDRISLNVFKNTLNYTKTLNFDEMLDILTPLKRSLKPVDYEILIKMIYLFNIDIISFRNLICIVYKMSLDYNKTVFYNLRHIFEYVVPLDFSLDFYYPFQPYYMPNSTVNQFLKFNQNTEYVNISQNQVPQNITRSQTQPSNTTIVQNVLPKHPNVLSITDGSITNEESGDIFDILKKNNYNQCFREEKYCLRYYRKEKKKISPSYWKLSKKNPYYSEKNCVQLTSYLNSVVISIPNVEKEGGNNSHIHESSLRRNPYQDELSRIEDERYEVDMNIQRLEMVKEQFEKFLIKYCKTPITLSNEIVTELFEPSMAVFIYKTIFNLYGDSYLTVITALYKKPVEAAQIIYPRLLEKLKEWKKVKGCFQEDWGKTTLKNHLKALDHQSLFFKHKNIKQMKINPLLKQVERFILYGTSDSTETKCDFSRFGESKWPKTIFDHIYLSYEDIWTTNYAFKLVMMLVNKEFCNNNSACFGEEDKGTGYTDEGAQENVFIKHFFKDYIEKIFDFTFFEKGDSSKRKTLELPFDENNRSSTVNGLYPGQLSKFEADGNGNKNRLYNKNYDMILRMMMDSNIYLFFRFHNLICNRLYFLWKLCESSFENIASIKAKPNVSNVLSSKIEHLKFKPIFQQAKSVIELFEYVISILELLLDGKIDGDVFEDECRYLLGFQCCHIFTIDKLLTELVKVIMNMLSSKLSLCLLDQFKLHSEHKNSQEYEDLTSGLLITDEDNQYCFDCFFIYDTKSPKKLLLKQYPQFTKSDQGNNVDADKITFMNESYEKKLMEYENFSIYRNHGDREKVLFSKFYNTFNSLAPYIRGLSEKDCLDKKNIHHNTYRSHINILKRSFGLNAMEERIKRFPISEIIKAKNQHDKKSVIIGGVYINDQSYVILNEDNHIKKYNGEYVYYNIESMKISKKKFKEDVEHGKGSLDRKCNRNL